MVYLLDTNAVIAILNNRPLSVRSHLRRALARGSAIVTSSVVLYELWYGVARSQHKKENADRLRAFLAGAVRVLPFQEDDAAVAGELRAELESKGKPIGPYDLLIAAQALRSRATLVSANTGEFSQVRGLAWRNWAA
ncbi:MAG: type II toxin-antitoxin system VapC family toxin [Dongiaceae bacterium]